MKNENVWKTYGEKELQELHAVNEKYKKCLDAGKTERECVTLAIKMAEEAGYRDVKEVLAAGKPLVCGDKVYANYMGKALALLRMGEKPISAGMNILGAHIDSPRIDIKQNPLYENEEFAYLDTHYYGGIKKYQWVTIPLAIHGVVVKKNGEKVVINIGEKEDDPVFFISDLLVHLAAEQLEKKASKVIEGEALDIIIGNRPLQDVKDDEKKEKVQAFTLKLLKEQYGIEEKDFLSAELEIVPAGEAREAGLDRSMVLGYGQDDRVCAFSSLEAILEVQDLKRTGCCILVDKEEIGSVGATGMQSRFFENAVAELLALTTGAYNDLILRRCLANSRMLSSDVSSAFDPTYAASFDKKNVAYLGHGMVFNKFTGARGKSGSNDANAEYLGFIRKVMDDAGVTFQTAELGKVDLGGGGTIAYILSLYGMNVIDCGVPVLNMHAPHEATSKADLYEAKCGYKAFLEA